MSDAPFYLSLSLLGGLILFSIWTIATTSLVSGHPPSLAVVDMDALVAHQSQILARRETVTAHPSRRPLKVPPQKIWEGGRLLKEKLDAFAQSRNLILLNKGSVAGGSLPDHTEGIKDLLEKALPALSLQEEEKQP